MPTINISLSQGSVAQAREQLQDVKQWLIDKNAEFVKRLAEHGIPVIDRQIALAQGDSDKTHYTHVKVVSYQTYAQATLVVDGKDILFLEYGAGITYNKGENHPFASQHGYGVGTYNPSSNNAFNPKGWWYRDGNGLHHSFGTEATMPVYRAYSSIIENVKQIASEVFK